MFLSRQEIASSLLDRKLDEGSSVYQHELALALANLARDGAWLETTRVGREPKVGASKIGGSPDLPSGLKWPTRPPDLSEAERFRRESDEANRSMSWWRRYLLKLVGDDCATLADYYARAAPLPFLAQLNFSEINADGTLEDLPKSGMLYVFYDHIAQPWGFDPLDSQGSRIVWIDNSPASLQRISMEDAALFGPGESYSIRPASLNAKPCLFPMDWDDLEVGELNLEPEQEDDYSDWCIDHHEYPNHRLLGHPSIIQGEMKTECALVSAGHNVGSGNAYRDPGLAAIRASAKDWRLLLQIDSDDQPGGLLWGDLGTIYLWILEKDLQARNFEKVVVILQCS